MERKIHRPASTANNVNRNELPIELREQLTKQHTTSQMNDVILDWAEKHNEPFNVDDVLIALYELESKIYKRAPISARLHKLHNTGHLSKPHPGLFRFKHQ